MYSTLKISRLLKINFETLRQWFKLGYITLDTTVDIPSRGQGCRAAISLETAYRIYLFSLLTTSGLSRSVASEIVHDRKIYQVNPISLDSNFTLLLSAEVVPQFKKLMGI